jgi:hypothetical protein
MRRIAATYARLIGILTALFGAWLVLVNVVEHGLGENTYEPPSVLYMVIGFGLVGLIGSVAFLLSWDGPDRFRSKGLRLVGWLGMVFMTLLPWSFTFIMLPLVVSAGLTLLVPVEPHPPR